MKCCPTGTEREYMRGLSQYVGSCKNSKEPSSGLGVCATLLEMVIFLPGAKRLKLGHDHCPKVGGVMAWLGVDCLKVGGSGSGYIDHLATARVTVGASRCDPNATVAKCLDNCSGGA